MSLPFYWIALFLAVGLALLQLAAPGLPLLTKLVISEFGAISCLIGAGLAFQATRQQAGDARTWIAMVLCLLFAAGFAYRGFQLWPEGGLAGALEAPAEENIN